MIGIILAAGEGTRCGGRIKAALEVKGERLLDRAVRMFKPHLKTIYLVTHHGEALENPDVVKFNPVARRWKCETLNSTSELWTDTMLFLHGDVWWDDGSSDYIADTGGDKITWFWDGKQEMFAIKCPKDLIPNLKDITSRAVSQTDPNANSNDCTFGSLWHICVALGIPNQRRVLRDNTSDIDSLDEYEAFCSGQIKWPKCHRL